MNQTFVNTDGISSIAIPTRNRIGELKRCVISFAENAKSFGRTVEFFISDDSPAYETRVACRAMLREVQSKYDMTIRYAGLEEKVKYARLLMEFKVVPPDVIKFALF